MLPTKLKIAPVGVCAAVLLACGLSVDTQAAVVDKAEPAVSVQSAPAVVVKTVPEAGDTKVDARTIKEIRVTFSKDMGDKSWSWSQISKDSFPQTTGKPRYDTDK